MRTPRNTVSTRGKLFFWNTIIGDDGLPYMTRIGVGRRRLHVFYRGDNDPDPHDHPWGFWTFPLTPYVEEVTELIGHTVLKVGTEDLGGEPIYRTYRQVVPAFRVSFRPASHTHRVLGRWDGEGRGHRNAYPAYRKGKIVTLVCRTQEQRAWGFLKNRDGKWCWTPWKDYVFGGGKDAPCQ